MAWAITIVSLGMRSVLNVGGTCASGNSPYVIRQQCPTGVDWLLPRGIWAGLGFVALFVLSTPAGGKKSAILAWSGLFLALGWNFLQYGLPIQGHGVYAGWLVPGILFVLMGIAPLFIYGPAMLRTLRGGEPSSVFTPIPSSNPYSGFVGNFGPNPNVGVAPPSNTRPGPMFSAPVPPTRRPPAPGPGGSDVTNELERLAALHRSGDLNDAEYESAKRAVVFGGGT